MACSVLSTPEFDEQLSVAVTFRLERVGRRSASRLLDALEGISEILAEQPLVGSLVRLDEETPQADALRWVRLESYVLVYRPHEADGTVVLTKLFHSGSDWRRHVVTRDGSSGL